MVDRGRLRQTKGMPTGLGDSGRGAIRSALTQVHGVISLHKTMVVERVVTYHGDRGEALTELPLSVPRENMDAWEGRWKAKLTAAGVVDLGDQADFLAWAHARSAPARSGGVGQASGLAKSALLALETSLWSASSTCRECSSREGARSERSR